MFEGPGPHASGTPSIVRTPTGESKFAGEVYQLPHLTVRTSFVGWGPRGLLADLSGAGTVRASNRLLWSGHTVDTVADALVTLAERSAISGLMHMPGEFQSRWELCQALMERFDLPARVIRDDEYEADRRLISTAWDAWGLPALPSFAEQLETMERP